MFVTVILFLTVVLVYVGRVAFGRWFNHFSLYAAIWGLSLTLFELRFIRYYALAPETWLVICAGSLAFFLGSLTVWAYRLVYPLPTRQASADAVLHGYASKETEALLVKGLWVLSLASGLAVLQHWYVMSKIAGGVANVVVFSSLLYRFRVEHGVPGGIPYLKMLGMTGALFGGVLTGMTGRFKAAALAPILVILLGDIVIAGRATTIQASILFVCGYTSSRYYLVKKLHLHHRAGKMRSVAVLILVFAVILGGIEFIRSTRSGAEIYAGSTTSLNKLSGGVLLTPSIYLYVTSNYGVLNQYLKEDVEHTPWGSNVFGPVYHVLAKLGSTTNVSFYQRFYKTPAAANTGTYLRELHADFGIVGVLLYPYILGLVSSIVWFSLQRRFRFTTIMWLGFMLAAVVMALFVTITRGGDMFIALGAGLLFGRILDRNAELAASHSPLPMLGDLQPAIR